MGCGLTDSDCKDLSAVVVKDNDGAADIDANNAKNKKKNITEEMFSETTFFSHTVYLYYILISIYIH